MGLSKAKECMYLMQQLLVENNEAREMPENMSTSARNRLDNRSEKLTWAVKFFKNQSDKLEALESEQPNLFN